MLEQVMTIVQNADDIAACTFKAVSGAMVATGYADVDVRGNGIGSALWSLTFTETAIIAHTGILPASLNSL